MYINVPFSKIKFLELLNNHKILCKSCLNRDKPCLTKYNRALFVHTTVKSNSYQRIPQARLDPNTCTSQHVYNRVHCIGIECSTVFCVRQTLCRTPSRGVDNRAAGATAAAPIIWLVVVIQK